MRNCRPGTGLFPELGHFFFTVGVSPVGFDSIYGLWAELFGRGRFWVPVFVAAKAGRSVPAVGFVGAKAGTAY